MKQQKISIAYRFRLILLAFLTLPLLGSAQSNIHVLRLQGGPEAMTGHVQKHIHELIIGMDGSSRASFHQDLVKVKMKEGVSAQELLTAFNQMGVGTFELRHADRAMEDSTMPQYVDTGNAQADAAAYDQAKQQWIQANPEQYLQISGADEPQQTVKPN